MKKMNGQTPYMLMTGAVALVAIVALVLNSTGSLEGAPVFETTDDYQKLCTDDDPTDDFLKKGTAKVAKKSYADRCDGDYLVQHYCKTGREIKPRKPYDCNALYNGCFDGACLAN